jgi:hypothetical protein
MRGGKALVFLLAVAISVLAAGYRWGDSGHAIGLIKAHGGSSRHPLVVTAGEELYSLIVTATVIPPYSGDVEITLEGEPQLDYDIYLTEPVIDLGLRRKAEYQAPVLKGLRPRDRLALWVVIRPSTPAHGRYDLSFCDTRSGQVVLSVPVIFAEEGENDEGH